MSELTAEDLLRIATRIDAHAISLRSRARALNTANGTARWRGSAATTAQHHMHHTVVRMGTAADHLEQAARALRSHAHAVRRVEHALRDVKAVEKRVDHLAMGAAHAIEGFL